MGKRRRTGFKGKRIRVDVRQSSSAQTGQGGNPISINASDVGVVRTDVQNK
ncbi:hypothetical protein L8C07_23290 [Paenibacillus sp. CMAA1739]|uniref:hypothetical protein n=1 Tax=Paenibacillus ottowii TaxID=2315729 RepID=UPI0027315C76|nr:MULTISPECIES: hypothetical protein [Paenibacillus]MDP1512896.1 hypothetical protein [Paenibacillus ottowii]MEC4568878.1 hypothetical protein [Paenibacillus sp. CMAA1739]